jgi:hypothetical protein
MSREIKYIGYLALEIPCGLPDYVERRGSRSSKSASDWRPPGLTPPYCSHIDLRSYRPFRKARRLSGGL